MFTSLLGPYEKLIIKIPTEQVVAPPMSKLIAQTFQVKVWAQKVFMDDASMPGSEVPVNVISNMPI